MGYNVYDDSMLLFTVDATFTYVASIRMIYWATIYDNVQSGQALQRLSIYPVTESRGFQLRFNVTIHEKRTRRQSDLRN